jgi:hypothetical protein
MPDQGFINRIIKHLGFIERHLHSATTGRDGNSYTDRAMARNKADLAEVRRDIRALKQLKAAL